MSISKIKDSESIALGKEQMPKIRYARQGNGAPGIILASFNRVMHV